MTLVKFAPMHEMRTLRNAMSRMLDDAWIARGAENGGARVAPLPLDAYTTDNEIVVIAPVPGVSPNEVEITVEGDTLTIQGEIPARLENVNYVFAERFVGPFKRTLQLNVPVDVDKIEATFEDGVLTLVLPKAETVRPRIIKVQTK